MRLFSDINEIKQKITLNGTFELSKIRPDISRTERSQIQPLLGNDFYNELTQKYAEALIALESKTEAEKKKIKDSGTQYQLMDVKYWPVMEIVQDAIANITFMNGIDQVQVSIGDSGVTISTNDTKKTAFQWQIDNLKYQFASNGFNALNELLLYLEKNLSDFPIWAQSDAYFEQKKFFVETAEVFSENYQINANRMTYLTLRYIMKRVEWNDVRPKISEPLFLKLKEKQLTGYETKEKILMERFLVPGIVLLTVAKGIVERAIEVTDLGVQINLYTYYVTLKDARKKGGDDEREKMIKQLTEDGNKYLDEARNYIDANEADFPDAKDVETEMSYRVINKPESGIFGM